MASLLKQYAKVDHLSIGATLAYSVGKITIVGNLATGYLSAQFTSDMVGGIIQLSGQRSVLITLWIDPQNIEVNNSTNLDIQTPEYYSILYGGISSSGGYMYSPQVKTTQTLMVGNMTLDAGAPSQNVSISVPMVSGSDTIVDLSSEQTLTNKTLVAPKVNTMNGLALPSQSGALVGTTGAQTISGKTFTDPIIQNLKNGPVSVGLPTSSDHLVGLAESATLQNKTLVNPTINQINNLTFPSGTCTLVGLGATQTLSNKTLTDPQIERINGLTVPTASAQLLTLSSSDTLTNKTLVAPTVSTLAGTVAVPASGTAVDTSSTQTLTNKTLVGPTVTTLGGLGLPTTSGTFATLNGSETLQNKTFTDPTIDQIMNAGATLTLPTSSGTLVAIGSSGTLTGKKFGVLSDLTKTLSVSTQLNTTGKGLTLATGQTTSQTLQFPNLGATDTAALTTVSQTLKNKTLGDVKIADPSDSTKYLRILASGNSTLTSLDLSTQQTTNQTLMVPNLTGTDTLVTLNATQTLQNKTLVNYLRKDASGNVLVKSLNSSSTAMRVQDSAGTNRFYVSAASGGIVTNNSSFDGSGANAGYGYVKQIYVGSGSSNAGSLKFSHSAHPYSVTIQANAAPTGLFYLSLPPSAPTTQPMFPVMSGGASMTYPAQVMTLSGTITGVDLINGGATKRFLLTNPGGGVAYMIHYFAAEFVYGGSQLGCTDGTKLFSLYYGSTGGVIANIGTFAQSYLMNASNQTIILPGLSTSTTANTKNYSIILQNALAYTGNTSTCTSVLKYRLVYSIFPN